MLSQGVKSELGRCMKKYCKYVWSYFDGYCKGSKYGNTGVGEVNIEGL